MTESQVFILIGARRLLEEGDPTAAEVAIRGLLRAERRVRRYSGLDFPKLSLERPYGQTLHPAIEPATGQKIGPWADGAERSLRYRIGRDGRETLSIALSVEERDGRWGCWGIDPETQVGTWIVMPDWKRRADAKGMADAWLELQAEKRAAG